MGQSRPSADSLIKVWQKGGQDYRSLPAEKKEQQADLIAELYDFYTERQIDSAAFFVNEMQKLAKDDKSSVYWFRYLNMQASLFLRKGQTQEAQRVGQEAMIVAKNLTDNRKLLVAYNLVARIAQAQQNHEQAMQYHVEALKLAEQTNQPEHAGHAAVNIGNLYLNDDNLKESFKYYRQGIGFFKKAGKADYALPAIINLGSAYFYAENYDSARFYFNKGLEAAKAQSNFQMEAIALLNLGIIAGDKQGQYQKGVGYFRESLRMAHLTGSKAMLIQSHIKLGNMFTHLKNMSDSARYHLTKALSFNEDYQNQQKQYLIYLGFSELEKSSKNYKEALIYLEKYQKTYNEWVTALNDSELKELTIAYETEKKEKENIKLTQEKKLLIEQQKAETNLRYALFIGLSAMVLALAVVWLVAVGRKRKLRQNAQLYEIEQERAVEREAILTAQKETKEAENQLLQIQIASEQKEAVSKALQLSSQEQRLQLIKDKLQKAEDRAGTYRNPAVERAISYIDEQLESSSGWEALAVHFNKTFPDFFRRLREKTDNRLSDNDERMCAFIRMRLSNKEMARLLNIETRSVFTNRHRLKERIGLESTTEIEAFVFNI